MALADSGRRNLAERIRFVLREGVLQFGLPMGLGMFLWKSYEADAWLGPRQLVHLVAYWVAFGVLLGLHRLYRDERRLHPEDRSFGTV